MTRARPEAWRARAEADAVQAAAHRAAAAQRTPTGQVTVEATVKGQRTTASCEPALGGYRCGACRRATLGSRAAGVVVGQVCPGCGAVVVEGAGPA